MARRRDRECHKSSEFSAKHDALAVVSKLHGTPYFSLDVSDVESSAVQRVLDESKEAKEGSKLEFMDGRAAMGSLSQFDSAVFSEARSLVDWTARNKVRLSLARDEGRGADGGE